MRRGGGKGLDHLFCSFIPGHGDRCCVEVLCSAVSGGGGILFPGRVGALSQQIATLIIIHLTRVSRHRLPSIWTPPVPCSSNTDRVSPDFWQFRTRYRVLVVPISTHMLYFPSCCCCLWQAVPLGFAWSLSVYR